MCVYAVLSISYADVSFVPVVAMFLVPLSDRPNWVLSVAAQ